MMPHEPVLDIMRRTIANLEFIERNASANGPYEVTQLINSFLGAMAHPWERLKSDSFSTSTADAVAAGWPIPLAEHLDDNSPKTLGDFFRNLRNGIAHGNISFLPGALGEIAALRIENRNRGQRTWGAIMTPNDMRRFLRMFVALVEEIDTMARKPLRIA